MRVLSVKTKLGGKTRFLHFKGGQFSSTIDGSNDREVGER